MIPVAARRALLAAIVAALACGGAGDVVERDAPAALAPVASGMPLAGMLERLVAVLDSAVAGDLSDDESDARLYRAEAITDRLLDSRVPFEWLTAERYSVDARLRQIQALADRVTAQLRSRAPRESVLEDARALRRDVQRLQAELAEGGGAAPTPLEQLLSAADTARPRRPPAADTID
jgi:hypothetical protein